MGFWLDPLKDESDGESGPGEQYGIFHRADRLSEIFCPGLLVVFVHGVNSDCRKAWTALPACLWRKLHASAYGLNIQQRKSCSHPVRIKKSV